MVDHSSTLGETSARTFPTYSRVARIDCRDQLAQVQGLANLTSVLFFRGMRLGQLACRPGKIKPKYHQTLICDRLFVRMALSSVFPLSLWCKLWDFGLNIFNINILWGLIFQEFHGFWLVHVFLADTIIVLKVLTKKI